MRNEQQCLQIHESGVEAKNHDWEVHGVRNSDMRIAMVFRDIEDIAVPPEPPPAVMEILDTPKVVSLIMGSIPDDMGPLEEVWLVLDTYVRPAGNLNNDYTQGDMAKDFAENVESEVKEALITHIFTDDLCGGSDVTSVVQPYALGDGGHLQWETPLVTGDGSLGPLVDAVKEGWPRD